MLNYPPLSGSAAVHRRHARSAAMLLATTTLLAVVVSASAATPPEHLALLHKDHSSSIDAIAPALPPSLPQEAVLQNYEEVIRAIQAYPEVAVFPIHVAGPVSAAARNRLSNKIAQSGGAGAIAVIYPDIGEPYRSIFAQIINGIEDRAKGQVTNFAIGPNVDVEALSDSLRRQDTRVVIALGRQGVKVASALEGDFGVVAGGVLMAPENEVRNIQVNSLSPDPALLFSRLKGMMPKVRRVYAVYDPRQNDWMMRLAREAAQAQGLDLVIREAQDLRSAVRAYEEIVATTDGNTDALWLPQDSTTVEESVVLPLVLKESWDRNLVVFSSSFGHVRRGVLFSLYPNNVELGRHLAGSALNVMAAGGNDTGGMLPLREVLMAVNLRTARHLGINASRPQGFDMSFPEQ